MRWFSRRKPKKQIARNEQSYSHELDYSQNQEKNKRIEQDLQMNKEILVKLLNPAPDLIVREVKSQPNEKQIMLFFLEGLVDKQAVNNNILRPLSNHTIQSSDIMKLPVTTSEKKIGHTWYEIHHALLEGNTVLMMEGQSFALLLNTQGWPQRQIQEPQTEASIKGAHQGFVETASQNIALIRRYIINPELKIQQLIVGRRGRSKVSLVYLRDVVNPEILDKLTNRIQKINVDAIINTGELGEFIEDNPYSPFPQFLTTERPDTAASHILQGRIAVVVDGSPGVLIAPMTFLSYLQAVDDYSMRWMVSSFIRLLRFVALFVAIFLPSLYIATLSYHYEILPLRLLISVGQSRAQIPLPPIFEALIMEVSIEMLREAGLRLPAPVGQTVGIVGGIVIGQAAVQAGIVSNIMVIVVAMTAIASFIIPNPDLSATIRLLRFPIMLVASQFGLYGIMISFMALIAHILALESIGTAYSSPFAPLWLSDWKDSIIRFPLRNMRIRPNSTKPVQQKKQEHHGGPKEP